jgi:hypothetical protein
MLYATIITYLGKPIQVVLLQVHVHMLHLSNTPKVKDALLDFSTAHLTLHNLSTFKDLQNRKTTFNSFNYFVSISNCLLFIYQLSKSVLLSSFYKQFLCNYQKSHPFHYLLFWLHHYQFEWLVVLEL